MMTLFSTLIVLLTNFTVVAAAGKLVLVEAKISAESTAECTAESSIVVQQKDLEFNHPQSVVTVTVECSCSASNIRAECNSKWLQGYIDAADLLVQGNGSCVLLPGKELPAHGSFTFTYEHSPPLQILPTDASFFGCSSSRAVERIYDTITLLLCLSFCSAIVLFKPSYF